MYNKDLAERILDRLFGIYPKKLQLNELQATWPEFSCAPHGQWLEAIQVLHSQGMLECKHLSGTNGWEAAADICLTEAGRQLVDEDARLEKLGDKLFSKEADDLYELVVRRDIHLLIESLAARGLARSSVFARETTDLIFDRLNSLRGVVVESYIRPLQNTKLKITELREHRLRRKIDQLWEQQLIRAKGTATNLCQSTGLSINDIQPQVSELEVRGRKLKLTIFDEIDIAKLSLQPEDLTNLSVASSPEQHDFSFVQNSELKAAVTRDRTELDRLDPRLNTKAVLVLSGAIIEALLLDAIVTSGEWDFEGGSRKYLNEMIDLAVKKGIIREDRLSHAVRRYRDLVHLGREIRERIHFTHDDATVARGAVGVVTGEVRRWYMKRSSTTESLQ